MGGQGGIQSVSNSSDSTSLTTSIKSRTNVNLFWLLFVQLRPIQWTKNTLLFAAMIFTIPHVTLIMFFDELAAFILFSLVAGCVYILNDYLDISSDRRDPEKCHRPMASGHLSPRAAFVFGALVLVVCLPLAAYLNRWFAVSLLAYLLLNIAYSISLKNIVVLDIFTIATGFVLRAAAGGFAISVGLTPWFLCCAMLLSLFLATGKRMYEFMVWKQNQQLYRKVLQQYSEGLLNQLSSVTAASVIMSYSIFTFSPGHTRYLMLTIPLVAYGIFRYSYLLHQGGQGGRPEVILVKDSHIRVTVALFVGLVVLLLYFFG